MKKCRFLTMVLLGGLIMIGLAGCAENRNSREWIENKVSEVSRVYPTENLFDLFKQFPEGFEVYQVYMNDKVSIKIYLTGNSQFKTITGKLIRKDLKLEKKTDIIDVNYIEQRFVFSDEERAKEIWDFKGFLFQELTINKSILSELKLESKSYNSVTNGFDISYSVNNPIINKFFKKDGLKNGILEFGSSLQSNDYYYYSVVVDYKDGYYFRETVSNGELNNGE
ncbi:hypothetical protein MK435_07345 [Streptococcus oralis]|uniref:Lipoprotein n=1 Tax=Streptococcus oralis TaxID=1303 RepID=A0A4Q2FJP0_STROR|nr:hypothetical protein [Streptococcus oralis]MCY7110687.1 hypothetical protein [Streptococcus oralis]RXX20290.1 hypothetical protein DF216_08190 [Streptococcus oralis]